MQELISIIIPNYNGAGTLDRCLQAALAQKDENFELILVDDASTDCSVQTIKHYPCTLVALPRHGGASRARNAGARAAQGRWLFFTDADCVLPTDTLLRLRQYLKTNPMHNTVLGGSYTLLPYDQGFFNTFQSVFVHYHETRTLPEPDYLATHALAIKSDHFQHSGGFKENYLPILEDVEFSHRLRQQGLSLRMAPKLLVRHIFNFSLRRSLANALRKTRYWVVYSLNHRDLFEDSGTASVQLKFNVCCFYLSLFLLAGLFIGETTLLVLLPLLLALNLWCNRGLVRAFFRADGIRFAVLGTLYYSLLYPLPIGLGTALGVRDFLINKPLRQDL